MSDTMADGELKSPIHDKYGRVTMNSILGCVLGIYLLPVVLIGFIWRAVVIAFTHGMEQFDEWDDKW